VEDQFGRTPRQQKLIAQYDEEIRRTDPKTVFLTQLAISRLPLRVQGADANFGSVDWF